VDAFADEWGFIKTPTITFNTVQEVKNFTKTCAETGQWNGVAVEGFVVRTHVKEPAASDTCVNGKAATPYKPGSSFFFKVKFDEPYMMYRDWREVTRTLLAGKKEDLKPSSLPKSKMRRDETRVYVNWVIEEIKRNRSSFDGFDRGKGIVAARERFFKYLETEEGMKALAGVKKAAFEAKEKYVAEVKEKVASEFEANEKVAPEAATATDISKTIIVPVAIPGCGSFFIFHFVLSAISYFPFKNR
jgi:tRNA ligase